MHWHNAHALLRCVALFIASSALAANEKRAWQSTGVISAPEAVQAAAADGTHVFAIASTQIAKYDRATGTRIAVSIGEAQHLNSGFFWNGILYCAHSNFPKLPERSEIKVLDPESMLLTTHKDFGDFGGSLTWIVRHQDSWWLNFAKYGADNRKTFLVKFDANWNERGRWTYPEEVVRRLGRNSLSGGIWRQDELVVTGHDDPVLFRLRVPHEGNILEYVGEQSIPFTGQGIAIDPQTSGLVGINRAKKQIVFAAAKGDGPIQLRVMTYNIHHGEGTDGKIDLERTAKVILSAEPDLVALNEVDQGVERTNRIDEPAELARLTGMTVVFGDNITYQGGRYGNAVLSRLPILGHKNHPLPSHYEGERRGVLAIDVTPAPGRSPITFLATHLDDRPKDHERLASAKFINDLALANGDRPLVVAGDLNAVPDSNVLAEFTKHWRRSNETELFTYPAADPHKQIDYILVHPADCFRVVEARVLDEPVASDHRPVLVVLELPGASKD